jgi:hypothetical protein
MKRQRYTTNEIIKMLLEADELPACGTAVVQACQALESNAQTFGCER